MIGIGILIGLLLGMQANLERQAKVDKWLQEQSPRLIRLQYLERTSNKDLQQIKQLESWLMGRNSELEFLRVLQYNLPTGTKITDLTIEDGFIKDVAGITPSVSLLLGKIKIVPELSGLKLKGTITTSPNGELFHLEGTIVNCKL